MSSMDRAGSGTVGVVLIEVSERWGYGGGRKPSPEPCGVASLVPLSQRRIATQVSSSSHGHGILPAKDPGLWELLCEDCS